MRFLQHRQQPFARRDEAQPAHGVVSGRVDTIVGLVVQLPPVLFLLPQGLVLLRAE